MTKTTISASNKKDSKLYALVYAVCAFLLVICSLHCLISSFEINVNASSLFFFTTLFTGVFAGLSAFVKSNRKYTAVISVIFAVLVLMVLFSYDTLISQLNYVINSVLKEYSEFLDVPQRVSFATVNLTATALFVVISALLSFLLTFFLIRIRHTFCAIAIPIIVIIPCFILLNTLPDLLPLLTLITVLLTLFASSCICRTNALQSFAVVPVVAVFMAILVTVVFVLNPVESYERKEWQDSLLESSTDLLSRINHTLENGTVTSGIKDAEKEIDLSLSGPLKQTHTKVMTVDSMHNGRIYLKGVCYTNYENNTWSTLTEEQAQSYPSNFDSFLMTKSIGYEYTINIETERKEDILYTPYFLSQTPVSGTALLDVLVKNNDGAKNYDVSFTPCTANELLISDAKSYYYTDGADATDSYRKFVYDNYLSVPSDVRDEMAELADKNYLSIETKEAIVNSVREFVSNSASYSLDTSQVPQGKDIALWFLNESDTGYCVHFATATTLMLRTMGVPARYVSGYCIELDQNNENSSVVTSDNAHAWVEYFDDDIGWVPLDATSEDFSVAVYTPAVEESQQNTQRNTEQNTQQQPTALQSVTPTISTKSDEITIKQFSDTPDTENKILVVFVIIISALLLVVLTLILRRKITLLIRHKNFTTRSKNQRARYIYKYLLRLSKYMYIYIPERITSIVDKARFSGRQITEDELNAVVRFADERKKDMEKESPTIKKLYFEYILVII